MMNRGIQIGSFCFAAILVLFSSSTLRAQQARPEGQDYQALSEKFFVFLQNDKAADGVDYLFGINPALAKMTDQAEQLKTQFVTLRTLAGSYVSHSVLVETKVAGMFVYQHYLVAYQRQPISVRIKYYRPGTSWICYGLEFDTNLADMIEKAADAQIPLQPK